MSQNEGLTRPRCPSPNPALPFSRRLLMRLRVEEVWLLGLAVLATIAIRHIPITHDVVWQFWIARQMLGGMQLYTDILEINPPLWFWSAIPVQWLAEAIGVSPMTLLRPLVMAAACLACVLLNRLLPLPRSIERAIIITVAFVVVALLPLYDFGQREQLALLAAIPYSALIAARHEQRQVSASVAVVTAIVAAYGFALKHYFVAVPMLLEAWLVLGVRGKWCALRPETLVMAAGAVSYASAVLVFAPRFLTDIVPQVRLAYAGYEVPLPQMFDEAAQIVWAVALLALGLYAGRTKLPRIAQAFLLLAAGFMVAYFTQRKGWQYHAIPVTGGLLIALACIVAPSGAQAPRRYPLALIVAGMAILATVMIGPYRNLYRPISAPLLASIARGAPVTVWASDPSWSWPMVEDLGLRWTSGYYAQWMLPAIAHAEMVGPPNAALARLGTEVRRRVGREMACNPPDLVLSERTTPFYSLRPRGFDTRGFFLRDPAIRSLITHYYRAERSTIWFDIYRRVAPVRSSGAAWCRSTR